MEYCGNNVSKGVAIGKAFLYEPFVATIGTEMIHPGEESGAISAYEQALEMASAELDRLRTQLENQGAAESKIFAAQGDILHDIAMDEEIRYSIIESRMNPAQAVDQTYTLYASLLEQTKDSLIRERAADLRDVRGRLLRCLAGVEERSLTSLQEPVIVLAHDLLPSDTAALDRSMIRAIVAEVGGSTSHSAIIARGYEIPAILGVSGICTAVHDGETIVVDALSGVVVTQASETALEEYRLRAHAYAAKVREEKSFLTANPTTRDGIRIETDLNIGSANEQELSFSEYTDGVGLFRTEFLYMNRSQAPDEEEQFRIYRKVLERFGTRPVTLRTLDIGGDKQVDCLPLPKEQNPFLGNRALRFCLSHEEIFLTQLRAALRASVYGNLWLMFPMVGSMEDIRIAKAMVDRAKSQLTEAGQPFSSDVKTGVMIEIPSLAMISEHVVKEVDFASIGTNDLTQYLLAADRGEPAVAQYYQMYHPAVFRLIRIASEAFESERKPLCVCGELGGDLLGGLALLGLGLRRLSMGESSIAAMKKMICSITMQQAQEAAAAACASDTAQAAKAVLTAALDEITK